MEPIHQSTAKLASDCLARYHAEVIEKRGADNGWSVLGTLAHRCVEEAYRADVDGSNQLAAALATLDDEWSKRDKSVTPVWVYSQVESIIRRAYHIDSRLRLVKPRGARMAVEQAWYLDADFQAVKKDDPGIAYAGRFDAVLWGPKGIEVHDWKSIYAMPRAADLESDIQARLYALAALALFPDAPAVTFRLILLRHDYEISLTFERGGEWEAPTRRWFRAIRSAVEMARAKDEWPATPGAGCQYCPLRWSCDALEDAIRGPLDASDAAAAYLAAKSRASEAERIARECAERDPIPVGIGKVLGFKPGTRKVWKYGVADLLAQLRADGATDEDLQAWFPGPSISKSAMEAAATVLLKRGEIEQAPWEYVDMLREEIPSATFTVFADDAPVPPPTTNQPCEGSSSALSSEGSVETNETQSANRGAA